MLIAALVGLSACHLGRKHTTIVENGNGHYLKIESWGKVYFNRDETAIAYMSPGSQLKYQYNDAILEAENDGHGGVKYSLEVGGEKKDIKELGTPFIAEAVRTMIRKGYRGN